MSEVYFDPQGPAAFPHYKPFWQMVDDGDLSQRDLADVLRAYDVYIQDANDEDKFHEGWRPVCLAEFYQSDYAGEKLAVPVEAEEPVATEFPNKDTARRAAIIGIEDKIGAGGTQSYEGLTPAKLQQLVDEGFAELDERQNDAPSIGEFLEFVTDCPNIEITFHGYVVSADRADYRVSVEGFDAKAKTKDELVALTQFGRHADEFDIDDNGVYAWWD